MQPNDDTTNPLMSAADIRDRTDVSPAAVSRWTRHPTFPEPATTSGAVLYWWDEVRSWLATRRIPRTARRPGETSETTFADRADRLLGTRTREQWPTVPRTAPRAGSVDVEGLLAAQLPGRLSATEFLDLVACLILLQERAPARWRSVRDYQPVDRGAAEGRRLLARIARETDTTLRGLGYRPGMSATVGNIVPENYDDVSQVVRRADGLGPDAFPLLLERYEHAAPARTMLHTPAAVARLMVDLVADQVATAPEVVYDPFCRSGELLAAAGALGGHGTVFRGTGPNENALRLAGIVIAANGRNARLHTASASPRDRRAHVRGTADVVLTNPPFNMTSQGVRDDEDWPLGPPPKGRDNFAWLQFCFEALREGGRAAVVLPNSAGDSESPAEREIRHHLVARGHLDCVLALPPELFATTRVPVTVWFLRADARSGDENGVVFIDASGMGSRNTRGRRTMTDDDLWLIRAAYQHRRGGTSGTAPDGLSAWLPAKAIHDNDDALLPRRYVARQQSDRVDLRSAFTELETRADITRHADHQVADTQRTYLEARPDRTSWQTRRLRDLCGIQAGPSSTHLPAAALEPTGPVPVIHPKHLRDRRVRTPGKGVSEELARRLQKFAVRAGDVLCVRTGTIGPTAVVTEQEDGWLIAPNLLRLRPIDARLRPDYLVAYLSLPHVQRWLHERAGSAAIPSISSAALGDLPVAVPPVEEQWRIGSALATFDAQLAAHRDLIEAATTARTALGEHLMAPDNGRTSR
jgi:type I restriction enzyme M protein